MSFAGMPSNNEIDRWIRELWDIGARGRYGYRMPGTPAAHRGAEYILRKFREFGLDDARIEQTEAPLCLPEEWLLEIRSGTHVERLACSFVRYAGFTPSEGISAPVISVGRGSEEEFAAANTSSNLKGSIVVVDLVSMRSTPIPHVIFHHDPGNTMQHPESMKDLTENWPVENLPVSYNLAKRFGAAGFLGILTFSTGDNNQFHHWYADGSIPALTISPNSGASLKDWLANGPVEATMVLTGTDTTGPISHVFASLPGTTEEAVAVHSHHDGWAVNEASGAAVVLALAKYFSTQPADSRRRKLQFVTLDSHFGKRPKLPQFWVDLLEDVSAAVSVEMIAKHFTISDGVYVDSGSISPTVFGVSRGNPALADIVRKAIVEHQLDRSSIVGAFFGDGNIYTSRGIPLIERIAHNAPQFTNDDTPDKVMIDKLQPTAAALADIIHSLDAMSATTLDNINSRDS